jgi:hypothetical protein
LVLADTGFINPGLINTPGRGTKGALWRKKKLRSRWIFVR